MQKHLTEIQYRCHSSTVLLNVTLKLLSGKKERQRMCMHVLIRERDKDAVRDTKPEKGVKLYSNCYPSINTARRIIFY